MVGACRLLAKSPMPSDPSLLPAPPLWRRLLAFVYDLLALLGLWVFVTLIAVVANGGQAVTGGPRLAALYAVLWLVTGGYFVLSWRYGGQTLGMRPWRLHAQAADGNRLSLARASTRYVCATLATATAGIGWLWSLVDRDRQAAHDRLAGTRLALLPLPGRWPDRTPAGEG